MERGTLSQVAQTECFAGEVTPTKTVTTQTNHFFAALCGYIKLELLKGNTKLNHFALKSKLYVRAIQSAYAALRELNPVQLAA